MSVFECFDEVYEIEPLQKLMLESLILPAPEDARSFSRWLAEVDFETLDNTSLRLVPALFSKFGDAVAKSSHCGRIKGICRYFFFANQLRFAAGRRVIEKMHDAGIDVLLFKGVAIALKYYRNIAIRPMADIDILVRLESVPRAEEILCQCGYQYLYPEVKKITDIHSHDYANGNRSGFDLHWHTLSESPHAGIDDDIWNRALVFDWDGLPVKVMAPEDLLLTSIVNGLRDRVIRPHWIHDVATIIAAEPAIHWDIVWEEARKRNLREKVFNALILVRAISAETIPDALLNKLVDNDLEFYRNLLQSAIAEGRTHGLIHARKDEIESILSSAEKCQQPVTNSGANLTHSEVFGSPRHIRFFLDENGAIHGLFLQWRHLPLVAELFEVSDQQMLAGLVSNHPTQGEGHLSIPAGLLATRLKFTLPSYGARITVVDAPSTLVLSPGQSTEITVEVENNTEYCWPISDGSKSPFGLSYHLLSVDGNPLIWNLPRCWLVIRRKGYVAFIEPSQVLICKLKITAPRELGRYIVQIDLVHEGILYFSKMNHQFLNIDLEVIRGEPVHHYAISSPQIAHETIDDETVIINTVTGAYYTANGYASLIWNAIVSGYSAGRIVSEFAAADIFDADEKAVEHFIASLVSEKLIMESGVEMTEPYNHIRAERRFEQEAPVLTRHPEPRELIAMHPVRGVSEHAGWPYPPDPNVSTNKAANES